MIDWGIIRIIFAVAFVGGHLILALYTLMRTARVRRRLAEIVSPVAQKAFWGNRETEKEH